MKQNKIVAGIIIIGLVLIVGVLVTATNDKVKLKEIDSKKLCEKETEMGVKEKKCKDDSKKIKLKDISPLVFEQDIDTGVIHIWSI